MAFGQYSGGIGAVVGGIIGAIVGAYTPMGPYQGAMLGASLGGAAGGVAGSVFWPEKVDITHPLPPKPHETRVQMSTYGASIPIQYDDGRMCGNIIYMSDVVETIERSKHRQDGVRYYEMVKTYTATFAIAFCEVTTKSIARIWMNGKVFADYRDGLSPFYPVGDSGLALANLQTSIARGEAFFSIYDGAETQLADPAIVAILGSADSPTYRGICYLVFVDFPIGEFAGIPTIEIELADKITVIKETEDSLSDSNSILNDGDWTGNCDAGIWDIYGGSFKAYIRFGSVDIPQGATIVTAKLVGNGFETGTDNMLFLKINIGDAGDQPAFTTAANAMARPLSTSSIAWGEDTEPRLFYSSLPTNQTFDSPDFSSLVQQVVNRGDWVSGNAMMIVLSDNGTTSGNLLHLNVGAGLTRIEIRYF